MEYRIDLLVIGRNASTGEVFETGALVDDAELVRLAQVDPKTFAELFDRYVDQVYRACYRRLGAVVTAEDATSTTFFNALAALPAFNPSEQPFRSWMFAIANNVVVDCYRVQRRRLETGLDGVEEQIDHGPLPDEQVAANDEVRRLRHAVTALPTVQRQIMELRLAGLNGPEIAAALGRNPGAIRIAQHRAIQRLRTLLSPGHEPTHRERESSHD